VIVLDASALRALLDREPGWAVVVRAAAGEDATTIAVNYAEELQKSARCPAGGIRPPGTGST
jgi:ribonuclease VapC